MCGIVGNSFGAPVDVQRLKHRGPDGHGLAASGAIMHGHVRLALLDLSEASAQPFVRHKSVLAFNGEIWNYRELRKKLRCKFTTTGDTEVLSEWMSANGIAGLNSMEGMFAFSWSHPKHGNWLVRDRFGEIPLYVRRSPQGWEWSSERKGFKDARDSHALPAGHAFNLDTGKLTDWRSRRDRRPLSELLEMLREGVRKRLNADAPVCCLISGGLDSSLILSLAIEQSKDVVAFTATYDEASTDLKSARRLCSELGVKLIEVPVRADEVSFDDALRAIELNSKAQIEIAVLCLPLAKAIADHGYKAVLSGEAADELFGGYGNFCIAASKANDKEIVVMRQQQVAKMARGNFVRCNKSFMAHGVECRLPFMEEELIDAVVHATKQENPPGKKLLKEIAKGVVPDWVIKRPKETFQGSAGTNVAAATLFANPKRYYSAELQRNFQMIPKD